MEKEQNQQAYDAGQVVGFPIVKVYVWLGLVMRYRYCSPPVRSTPVSNRRVDSLIYKQLCQTKIQSTLSAVEIWHSANIISNHSHCPRNQAFRDRQSTFRTVSAYPYCLWCEQLGVSWRVVGGYIGVADGEIAARCLLIETQTLFALAKMSAQC